MPTLENKTTNISTSPPLLRELFYGSAKTRKTWLAGTAAEAGFNVILIDSDHGYHVLLKNLSEKAKKRLMVIEARDGLKTATACNFLTHFLKFGQAYFNESTLKLERNFKAIDSNCIELSESRHLNANTVLIIDSYSALVRSLQMQFKLDNKIDLTAKFDTEDKKGLRDGFGWTGALASWMLERITRLPCQVIVIAHKSVYEKYSKDQKTIEWTRIQVKSTSGPHAMTIGELFSDILYFENVSSTMTKISTRPDKDAEGGSRLIPPDSYNWDKLQFKDICKYAGIHLPPEDLPYLDFSIKEKEVSKNETKQPIINTGKKNTTKIGALLKPK